MIRYNYVRGRYQSYDHPAHKRRFPKFAARHKISYSDFLSTGSIGDVNILSPAADLTYWSKFAMRSSESIVFDGNDPYLLSSGNYFRESLRGTFKYISGSHKYLELSYKKSYKKLCMLSDVAIAGHTHQEHLLKIEHSNVYRIPDYGIDAEIKIKTDYRLSGDGNIHVFWEGLGSSFKPFKIIEEIFKNIRERDRFIFHFVTDLYFYRIGDRWLKTSIQDVAKHEAPSICNQFRFYQWSERTMNSIAIQCDFGVIPLPYDRSLNFWKPENKLIHMWRLGLPVLLTPIPSYMDVITKAALTDCYATNTHQWIDIIEKMVGDARHRGLHAKIGFEFAKAQYSNEIIDGLWFKALDSL